MVYNEASFEVHAFQANKEQPLTSLFMPMDYFPVKNNEQQTLLDQFALDICACFNIPIRKIHLHKLWEETRPATAHGYGYSLKEFLLDVGRNSFIHDFYHSTDDFRREYERRFEASPPVNRVVRWRWEVGQSITTTQRNDAIRRLNIYKTWLFSQVFRDTNNNPIILLPVGPAEENYRDDTSSESPVAQEAWDQLWLSPILGAPEITVPIGQVPFTSKMTNREEMLPVVASLVAAPRSDLCLIDVVKRILEFSKRPTRVATGRQMFVDDWDVVERTRTP
ncbi:hypothetical protein AC578_985 [Pseudocercospora eumusae]|uniref:Amidase domain-containing protein n=1 Tax=Pseudocercospora eumusae TaxID=321146 RepID=A0A139HEE3_9PEZI|nr:hypothetical protein AC578_985 [Pseudocercospora eumusae]